MARVSIVRWNLKKAGLRELKALPPGNLWLTNKNRIDNPTQKDYSDVIARCYTEVTSEIKNTYASLNGVFRIYDIGADTDGYIEFVLENGIAYIKGQLGASFSSHSLKFEFEADQTLIGSLIQAIEL